MPQADIIPVVAAWRTLKGSTAIFLGQVGDSTHTCAAPTRPDWTWNNTTQTGNQFCNPMYMVTSHSWGNIPAYGYAISGAVCSTIQIEAVSFVLPKLPKYLFVGGGINNLQAGAVWSDEQTYFDTIYSTASAQGCTCLVEDVLPSGLATTSAISTWNAAKAAWVASKSNALCQNVANHDWLCAPADLTTISAPYAAGDGTHLSQGGVWLMSFLKTQFIYQLEGFVLPTQARTH